MYYKKISTIVFVLLTAIFFMGVPTTSAKDAKVITLRAADFYPPKHPIREGFINGWKRMFEERTKAIGHPVKIKYYGQGSLVKAPDLIDATINGICDMANGTYIGKYIPIVYFLQIPGMIKDDDVVKSVPAVRELAKKIISPYYEKLGLKSLYSMGGTTQYQLAGKGEPLTKAEELKGVTVRVAGKLLPLSARALGMKPVSMTMGEVHEAFERGVVDAVSLQVASYTHYAFFELIDWALLNLDLGQFGITSWVMNLKKYNSLPPEVKKVIEDIELEASQYMMQTIYDRLKHDVGEVWPKKGVKLVHMSKEEIDKKNKLLAPVTHNWLKKMEEKGYPMKKMMTVWENALSKQGIVLPEGINPYK